ncbi:MAG: sortase [Patescibacteria group bacterium]|nr:sortase [Patescibacteria group bacterium]
MKFEPYRYVKDYKPQSPSSRKGVFWDQILPLFLIFSGSFLISSQVVLPYFSFPSQEAFMIRPVKPFHVLGASQRQWETSSKEDKNSITRQEVPPTFYLSIPKLEIKKARVRKDSTEQNPQKFLGHLLGSALPGEKGGSIFIYGHSTFPWLFDSDNYRTIFSTLPELEQGDYIYIEYPGKQWVYKVTGFKTQAPEEVNPYESVSESAPAQLVLMTCVPPGTRLRRLLAYASLVDEQTLAE